MQDEDGLPGKVQQVCSNSSACSIPRDAGNCHQLGCELMSGAHALQSKPKLQHFRGLLQTVGQHAARVRDTNAAESCSAMGISMQSVSQGLRLGQFDCLADVDIAIEAACSTGLHAFLDHNPEGAGGYSLNSS
jgi:hypothetical protein